MENGVKKPWLSKTIILNFVMGIIAAVSMFVPAASTVSSFLSANAGTIALVWSVANIILRAITKDAISLLD